MSFKISSESLNGHAIGDAASGQDRQPPAESAPVLVDPSANDHVRAMRSLSSPESRKAAQGFDPGGSVFEIVHDQQVKDAGGEKYHSANTGNGYVVGQDQSGCLIFTNKQLVENQDKATAILVDEKGVKTLDVPLDTKHASNKVISPDGRSVEADKLYIDPSVDGALLHVKSDSCKAVNLGSQKALEPGDRVTAWGVGTDGQVRKSGLTYVAGMTLGELKRNRAFNFDGLAQSNMQPQTPVQVYEGEIKLENSGGPLVDASGKVVGTAVASNSKNDRGEIRHYTVATSARIPEELLKAYK